MKFGKLLFIILFLAAFTGAMAQLNGNCPGCVYNSSQFGSNITAFSVGLFPDSVVFTQDDSTDIDITYLLPQEVNTGISIAPTATVTEVQILGINGSASLPAGLSVTCDQYANGCQYYPQTNRYGCVKICGVTSHAATNGWVLAQVTVAGTGTAAGQTETQQENINFYYKILPDTSVCHTVCFQNKVNTGCDSATIGVYAGVDISCANPSLNPCSFDWAYGNGNTGSSLTTTPETYSSPGVYPVTLTQNTDALVITSAALTSLSGWSNICNLFGLDASANNYQLNFTVGSNNFSTSAGGSGTQTYTLNDTLTSLAVGVVVQDNCALSTLTSNSATVAVTGPGTYTWSVTGSNAASGSFTVSQVPYSSVSYTDSVYIYASPDTPVITAIADSICAGDSVLLSIGGQYAGYNILWFQDTTFLPAAVGDTAIYASSSGNYIVSVTNPTTLCSVTSAPFALTVAGAVSAGAGVFIDGGTQLFLNPFTPGNVVNWYYDSALVSGQNSQFLPILGQGSYYAVIYPPGFPQCSVTSRILHYSTAGINNVPEDVTNLIVYPNPNSGIFSVSVNVISQSNVEIRLTDMLGRTVYQNSVANQSGEVKDNINVSSLAKGVYTLDVSTDKGMATKRVVVE